MGAPLTCECDVPGCEGIPMAHLCEVHMPMRRDDPVRRESVIEGLAQAAAIIEAEPFSCPEIIRAEIERLRAEQKES